MKTNWTQRIAVYGGTVAYGTNAIRKGLTPISDDFEAVQIVPKFTNEYLDYGNEDSLYDTNHANTLDALDNSKVVQFEMLVDAVFLNSMRNLTGKDLRAKFEIRGGRHEGVFQLIELNHIEGDRYSVLAITTT